MIQRPVHCFNNVRRGLLREQARYKMVSKKVLVLFIVVVICIGEIATSSPSAASKATTKSQSVIQSHKGKNTQKPPTGGGTSKPDNSGVSVEVTHTVVILSAVVTYIGTKHLLR